MAAYYKMRGNLKLYPLTHLKKKEKLEIKPVTFMWHHDLLSILCLSQRLRRTEMITEDD